MNPSIQALFHINLSFYLLISICFGNTQLYHSIHSQDSFMSSPTDVMDLFHSMLKKLRDALGETMEMYQDYINIHGKGEEEQQGHFIRGFKEKKDETQFKKPSPPLFNQKRYQQKMRIDQLNKQVMARAQALPKETLSCKQRLAALKNLNKHIQKEHETKNHPSSTKEKKQNTAFFIYLKEKRESMARDYPELKPTELTRLISDNWKSMSQEERKPFYRQNSENRKQFNKNFEKCLTNVLKGQRKGKQEEDQGTDYEPQ